MKVLNDLTISFWLCVLETESNLVFLFSFVGVSWHIP